MKLFEYEAKVVAQKLNIPTPKGILVTTGDEAKKAFNEIGGPVVLKSQVLVAGRKKAGGIKFVTTADEAHDVAEEILGMEIKGEPVKRLLVEQRVRVKKELYVGITVDRSARCYTVLASSEGGVDIEEVATRSPEKIVRKEVNPLWGIREYDGRDVARHLGYSGKQLVELGSIVAKMFRLLVSYDGELVESNPLVETEDGGFVAADFRMILDDNALYRHPEYKEKKDETDREITALEARAREKGLSYVELDGNIGIVGNGAGLVMATLDMIQHFGGKPANFCDMGGGADVERISSGLEIVLANPRVKALFLNVLGGITRCDDVANAVVSIMEKGKIKIPTVIRMVGTNEEEGKRILAKGGIRALDSMEDAAKEVVAAAAR
jgi:succinyl-CoA synthetase beta subunit